MDQPFLLRRLAFVASLFGSAIALPGCTNVEEVRPPYYDGVEAGPTGSLGLSLTLSSGAVLDTVEVKISGAPLASTVTRNVPVEPEAATVSAQFGGLPQGNYSVALSAVSVDGDTTCTGNATFTITANQTVGVVVPLTCRTEGTGGEVIIDVGLNVCPTLEFLFIAPLKTPVGSFISVEASVVDPDGDPISYVWTADKGSFAEPSAAATNYTCTQPGLRTINLSTNDGGDCEQNTHVQVACILTSFTSCQPGQYQTVAPTELNDRECAPCATGTYTTIANAAACVPWTTCTAGEFVATPGTTSTNQTCGDCAAGTFSDEDDAPACAPWSECAWGQLEVAPGTAATDRQCGPGGEAFRQFGTTASERVTSLATGTDGSVYVVGVTEGALVAASFGSYDAFIRKYDWKGGLVWTRQFGTSGLDYAAAVATGADGSIYVAGYTPGTLGPASVGLTDAFLRKYDPTGTVVWDRQFGTTNHDYAYGVAVDLTGSVLVAGATQGAMDGANVGSTDGYVRKYDAFGNVTWTRQYGTASAETPAGVSLDASNSVYVTGTTSGSLAGTSAGGDDGYLRKYGPTGALVWTRQFGTSSAEGVYCTAADASGRIYVAGTTSGALGGTNAGGQDAFLRSYASDGAVLSTTQFGTSSFDIAYGIATRGTNDVYVAGITGGALVGPSSGGIDAFVRHYSGSSVVWSDQYGTTSTDLAIAGAADGSGAIFVGGYTDGALVVGSPNAGLLDGYVLKVPEP